MRYKVIVIIIAVILILVLAKLVYINSGVKTVRLDSSNLRNKYHTKTKALERRLADWYPLGKDDKFKIDHGSSYYRFFDRLGESHMVVAVNNDRQVVGVGCGVLRNVPIKHNKKARCKTWYICDVKVDPLYRGRRIPWQLMRDSWWKIYKSARFYGVSMDPKGKENPVIKLGSNIPIVSFRPAGKLLIYSCDFETMNRVLSTLWGNRGPITFVSLRGIKDIILQSTGKPMNLLHAHWGPQREKAGIVYSGPQKDATHMFCCPAWDPMVRQLRSLGVTTDVTATILHYNMDACDWKFILTSSI